MPWALMLLQKGFSGLGARTPGKNSLTSMGSGEEGPGRIHRFSKAVVKDLCDCKERSGRAWGLQAVLGCVGGWIPGRSRQRT